MKAKTKDLKALVAKVQKGIGNNPLMPLSSLVSVSYDGGKEITLKTFDGYNYVVSRAAIAEEAGAPFEACVNANTFVSLVNKTSSESVSLDLAPKFLAFKGNGNYKLDVVTDNGELLKFPEMEDFSSIEGDKVKVSVLLNSITVNEPSAAKANDVPMFQGCFFGNRVYTTDSQIACVVDEELIPGKAALFMYSTLKLLPAFVDQEATLKIKESGGETLFELSDSAVTILGKLISGGEKYPAAVLDKMVGLPLACVKVKVSALLDVLDRMNIFVNQYETNAVRLSFKDESLTITNYAGGNAYNAEETIDAPYDDELVHEEGYSYECFVDLGNLQADLKVCATPEARLGIGSEKYLRVSTGKTTFVLGLLDKKA